MRPWLALAPLGALCLLPLRPAAAADRLVLVVENRSANKAAAAELQPAIAAALGRKGYEIVAGPEVDGAVAAAGALHAESMPLGATAALLDKFHAAKVLVVTIHFLLDPQRRSVGPRANPAVGLSARAFTKDRIAWRNSLGVIDEAGADGAPPQPPQKPLATQASARLLRSFPRGAGATVASLDEEWEAMTGSVARETAVGTDYDVLIERLRATRAGPRFRLKVKSAR